MALYFCMNEVFAALAKHPVSQDRMQALVDVSIKPIKCGGYADDSFILTSSPRILDLREPGSPEQMAQLIDEAPLYAVNLELVLDEALSARHGNSRVANALAYAFGAQPLPNTLKTSGEPGEDAAAGLRHPMLGHINRTELCRLYIKFLQALDRDHEDYSFERKIIGRHAGRFLENHDGFVTYHEGKARAGILLAFGSRQDHDPARPAENYIEEGQKAARRMRITEHREILWAWLEADGCQARRCRDLDAVLSLTDLPRMPNWVRNDLFSCLEKESMKQFFAKQLAGHDAALSFLGAAPTLQKTVSLNAAGQVDETLQQLMTQVLGHRQNYAGAGRAFAQASESRANEARRAGLGSGP